MARKADLFIFLGMQAWVHVSAEKAAFWWARTSETHNYSERVCRVGKPLYLAGPALSRKWANGRKWRQINPRRQELVPRGSSSAAAQAKVLGSPLSNRSPAGDRGSADVRMDAILFP